MSEPVDRFEKLLAVPMASLVTDQASFGFDQRTELGGNLFEQQIHRGIVIERRGLGGVGGENAQPRDRCADEDPECRRAPSAQNRDCPAWPRIGPPLWCAPPRRAPLRARRRSRRAESRGSVTLATASAFTAVSSGSQKAKKITVSARTAVRASSTKPSIASRTIKPLPSWRRVSGSKPCAANSSTSPNRRSSLASATAASTVARNSDTMRACSSAPLAQRPRPGSPAKPRIPTT